MPFITRADLDRYTFGPSEVTRLLRLAGDNPADQQLILDGALEMGEAFILEYLPREALQSANADILRPIAAQEAVYLLKTQRNLGVTEQDEMNHSRRVVKMQHIRDRKMWAGDADNQRNARIGVQESCRPISTRQLGRGFL